MNGKIKILWSESPDHNDISLSRIATYLGIDCELQPVLEYVETQSNRSTDVSERDILACSLGALNRLHLNPSVFQDFVSLLNDGIAYLFVYGLTDNESLPTLQRISDGDIDSVVSPSGENCIYYVSQGFEDITRQLSGLRFSQAVNAIDRGFTIKDGSSDIDTLISVNDFPLFIRKTRANCQIFIAAISEILDIKSEVKKNIKITDTFSGLIPVMMFLRFTFQCKCWHSGTSFGCFVIDDPLLKPDYGYLNYKKMHGLMLQNDCHVSVAFIPWNFRRSNQKVVDYFNDHQRYFSLCIHGCDHTGGEFSPVDDEILEQKTREALRRMEAHKEKYGIDFDSLMVFPQQVFSSRALRTMKRNNIIAATDSGVIPFDNEGGITIESLLRPAFIDSEDFPVFQRRTPRKIIDFALDLFLGKPLIIFQHHDLFMNGYEEFFSFVRQLNSLSGSITWTNLESIVRESYWQKHDGDGRVHVNLFARRAYIENRSDIKRNYFIHKQETGNVPVGSVCVNGHEVDYKLDADELTFSIELPAGESAEIDITYTNEYTSTFSRVDGSPRYRLKVLLRRHLSEFRDVYVTKFRVINRIIQTIIGHYTHDYIPQKESKKSPGK